MQTSYEINPKPKLSKNRKMSTIVTDQNENTIDSGVGIDY